jgi:hypothetical protein
LPEPGFGLPKIYERVPREDEEGEDNVLCLDTGQRMDLRGRTHPKVVLQLDEALRDF